MNKIVCILLSMLILTGCTLVDIPVDPIVDTPVYEESVETVVGETDYSEDSYYKEPVQEESYTQSYYEPTPQGDVDYYTNVDGYQVQSPTYYDSTPAGASAQCNDGTYSFSRNRRGTCSGHGDVASWL